jgi:carboxyl-terminal processing protease
MRHFFTTSLIAVVAFGLAFSSGYVYGRSDASVRSGPVAAVLAPLDRLVPASAASADSVLTSEENARFRIFWETWKIVEREFLERANIDRQKLIYGAIKGMVDAVGDPYTAYLTPANRELADTDLRGSFDGVGVQVDLRDGKLTVISPIDGSPAHKAGVRPGDVITHADDKSLAGKTLQDTVLLIRGPRGTTVTLRVTREGIKDPLSFELTRAEIRLESVRSRMLDEGVGYLRITSFGQNTGAEATNAIKNLLQQRPRGFVVDLRSNPGGYLSAAVDVTSQFMQAGRVVLFQDGAQRERKTYVTETGGVATEAKVVVLVNRGTASASEIVAAALRDNGRATLIGEKTYGKGTVQNVHVLSDQSGLRVTTAQWLTPNEQPLQGKGIEPDMKVAMPLDAASTADPQLDSAVRLILGS